MRKPLFKCDMCNNETKNPNEWINLQIFTDKALEFIVYDKGHSVDNNDYDYHFCCWQHFIDFLTKVRGDQK